MARPKRSTAWYWGTGLLFAAGYFSIVAARYFDLAMPAPVLGTAVAVALTIPFAARARSVLRGALWGAPLGLAAAFGISVAMVLGAGPTRVTTTLPVGAPTTRPISAEVLQTDFIITAMTTMICCVVTGAIFALLAERRRRKLEEGKA